MANYTSICSFLYRALHLKGEEVFRFVKQLVNCPLGEDNDFHRPNRVNFFRPQVTILAIQPNVVENVGM
jgi:hypothetical protein